MSYSAERKCLCLNCPSSTTSLSSTALRSRENGAIVVTRRWTAQQPLRPVLVGESVGSCRATPIFASSLSQGAGAIAGTKVDWLENEDAHVFKADLLGLKKAEMKVELEDGRILSISRERSQEKKGDKWYTVERSYGNFLGRFKLPENAQADSVSPKVDNGVVKTRRGTDLSTIVL